MRLIDADKMDLLLGISDRDIYAKQMLDHMETIDAVPVVYCRECKHARDSKDAFDWDGETPLCECDYMTLPHRRYEHCSWGERKEATHDTI